MNAGCCARDADIGLERLGVGPEAPKGGGGPRGREEPSSRSVVDWVADARTPEFRPERLELDGPGSPPGPSPGPCSFDPPLPV